MEETLFASVRTARCSGVETFARIGDRIQDTRAAAEALADRLAAIGRLTEADGAGGADLRGLASRLKDEIGAWREGEDGSKDATDAAISAISDVETQSHQLLAIASMTEINASTLDAQLMLSYVTDLKSVAQSLGEGAKAVNQTIAKLHVSAMGRIEDMGAVSRALEPILETLQARAPSTDGALNAVSGASNQAAAEAERRARENVRRLIEAMQFSDMYSQRLEHVEAILEDSAQDALQDLAAAQLDAAAEDGDGVARDLEAVLADLNDVAEAVETFASAGDGARAEAVVSGQRDELLAAVSTYESLAPRLLQADQSAEALASNVEATVVFLQKLVESVEHIQLAAVNAELISARLGGARGPLSVLALAVRDTVQGSTDRIVAARAVLDRLHIKFGAEAQAPMTAAMQALNEEIEATRASVARHDQSLDDLGEIKDQIRAAAEALTANTGAARSEIARIEGLMRALNRLAADAHADAEPDEAALDRVWALYTMAREREVHLARYPRAEAAESEPVDDFELF